LKWALTAVIDTVETFRCMVREPIPTREPEKVREGLSPVRKPLRQKVSKF
jgi:hypothetical protein